MRSAVKNKQPKDLWFKSRSGRSIITLISVIIIFHSYTKYEKKDIKN
jgi:hypothetical protein